MIIYDPIDGYVLEKQIEYMPRTCFIMTQLSTPIPGVIKRIRKTVAKTLANHSIGWVDAESETTGKDFLDKIWNFIIRVPMGIAIIEENMPSNTLSNIFYEVGLMQAYGKETLVIKTEKATVPSDLNRNEYVEYKRGFNSKLISFVSGVLKRSDHFERIADSIDDNPLLAIDYLRRAYLISGDSNLKNKAIDVFNNSSITGRARNSVENLLIDF